MPISRINTSSHPGIRRALPPPDATEALLRLAVGNLRAASALLIAKSTTEALSELARMGRVPLDVVTDEMLAKLSLASEASVMTTEKNWSIIYCPLIGGGHNDDEELIFIIAFSPPEAPRPELPENWVSDIRSCSTVLFPTIQQASGNAMACFGIPDRSECYQALEAHAEQAARFEKPKSFGLIRISVGNLAVINERYGWDIADRVLETAIDRIGMYLPEGSFFGHLGGSHFLVLTPLGTSVIGTRTLISQLVALNGLTIESRKGSIALALTCGWAMYPQDSVATSDLLVDAKAALARTSMDGISHDQRASRDITAQFLAASGLEQDLSRAVLENMLFLKWMPIVETTSQQIVAYEALLRWNRPGIGEIPPEMFLQSAEDAGLIEQLDGWSLRNACAVAVKWRSPLRVCVNISPSWLVTERLSKLVAMTLQDTGLDPTRLQIEFSECKPFGPTPIAHREIARIRAMGVRIALDDFGRGFASLERLSRFPLDQIKLDRSFTRDAGTNSRVDAVLTAVLRLARVLSVACCANGVETERQMAILDTLGCDEVQGFLLGAPERHSPA